MTENLEEVILRLTQDLEETQQEKVKAAEYGLQVLSEKQILQQRCEELELLLENSQKDFEFLKNEFELNKEALEASKYINRRAVNDREVHEQTILQQKELTEDSLSYTIQNLESELNQTKTLLKNAKGEADGLTKNYSKALSAQQALEKKNAALRLDLREAKALERRMLSEYSELEEENCSLQKQVSALRQSQAEYESFHHEIGRLSEEADYLHSQLEEASKLNELLGRQLDEALDSLAKERELKIAMKKDYSLYKNIYDLNHLAPTAGDAPKEPGPHEGISPVAGAAPNFSSLFSELNISEVAVLKEQLLQAEAEKVRLQKSLSEIQDAKNFDTDKNTSRDSQNLKDLQSELEDKNRLLVSLNDEKVHLGMELNISKTSCQEMMVSQKKISDDLTSVVEKLSHLYHHVCMKNREVPKRIVLDYMKKKTVQSEQKTSSAAVPKPDGSSDDTDSKVLMSTISTQIDHLREALDQSFSNMPELSESEASTKDAPPTENQAHEEELIRLRSLLSSKREQIATLRTVLKANKHTAEVALSNLKTKYQKEKAFVADTILKLRSELKALKEDAATFASLRAMFAARCDEYVVQLDDMQRQLAAADNEKQTLNHLLRLAIQQKLALTQRLEDLEFDREQHTRQLIEGSTSSKSQGKGFMGITSRSSNHVKRDQKNKF